MSTYSESQSVAKEDSVTEAVIAHMSLETILETESIDSPASADEEEVGE